MEGKTELRPIERVPFTAEMADGVWVQMRGRREYLVAPLNFKAIKALQGDVSKLESMSGVPTPDQIDVVARTMKASLAWNYPDITEDEVLDLIDLANFMPAWKAMIGASGLSPREPPGEARPASP